MNRTFTVYPTVVACLACLLHVGLRSERARGQSCASSTTVGLDTSYINTWALIGQAGGEAVGETFVAPYTDILAITLWRSYWDTPNGSIWRIFVLGVDSAGRPDNNEIIQDGPSLYIWSGDGVHPTPFRFVFNPPIHLPSVGTYELAVQADSCFGNFLVAGDLNDDYPDGIGWYHGRENFCEYKPRSQPEALPDRDLNFLVEFCPPETPAHPTSWGRIKSLYR